MTPFTSDVLNYIYHSNADDSGYTVGRGPVTDLEAGSTFVVSWYLGYAHLVSRYIRVAYIQLDISK